jgi:hypothetical protein
MRKGLIIALTLTALVTLNGCVLPPIVTLASYSVDIITYEATGKTATDHVYSAVARSDCSFVRVLHEKPICVDPPATADAPANTAVASSQTGQASDTEPASLTAVASATTSQTAKVTLGSFRDQANAERTVARYADWHPVITNVTVGGQAFHRVVASALSGDEAAALKAKLAADQPARLRVAQN